MPYSKSLGSGNWTYELTYYPTDDNADKLYYFTLNEILKHLNGETLIDEEEKVKKLNELIDDEEKIRTVMLYRCPLSSWQLTTLLFYHQFIVFETTNWYWSVEKTTGGIVIQRSKHIRSVTDMLKFEKRVTSPNEIKRADCGKTMKQFVHCLMRRKELSNAYHLINANTREFSNTVFDEMANPTSSCNLL